MATKKTKPEAPVFEKETLVKEATAAFGVSPEYMAGALHTVKEPITVAEANKLLEKFKKGVIN